MSSFFEENASVWIGITFIIAVAALGVTIYNVVMINRANDRIDTRVAEIKSKIGSVVREINNINRLEYQVNVSQDQKIDRLENRA